MNTNLSWNAFKFQLLLGRSLFKIWAKSMHVTFEYRFWFSVKENYGNISVYFSQCIYKKLLLSYRGIFIFIHRPQLFLEALLFLLNLQRVLWRTSVSSRFSDVQEHVTYIAEEALTWDNLVKILRVPYVLSTLEGKNELTRRYKIILFSMYFWYSTFQVRDSV